VASHLGDLHHRSILVVDIEGYSLPARTNSIRGRLRGTLYLLLEQATSALGVAAAQHDPPSDQGDGALVLFHPQVPKNRLLHPLISDLAEGLGRYNLDAPEAEQLRLRVVVHAGELLSDDHGYFGEDLDEAFALLNSDTLRTCLSQTAGPLVLLVTERIYHGIVRHGLVGIDRASYRPVDVPMKRSATRAWVPRARRRPRRRRGGVAVRAGQHRLARLSST
jgi:hypothetical protein